MHTHDGQVAASSGGNPDYIVDKNINTEGFTTGFTEKCGRNMKPPTVVIGNNIPTMVTRGTQTDRCPHKIKSLRSDSATDAYGDACEGGLYRPAQPNVVKLKPSDSQTETVDGEESDDGNQFAIITDEEDEGVEVEEVEFASRRNSCVPGSNVGVEQANFGLGIAGDSAVGGVSPSVLDVLDGLDEDLDASYEVVVDIEGPSMDVRIGGAARRTGSKPEMSGALTAENKKRKVREALVELDDEAVGQQPALKRTSY